MNLHIVVEVTTINSILPKLSDNIRCKSIRILFDVIF